MIERLWSSLQDRLPKDFIRLGIHTLEEANNCLPDFMTKWNCQHSHAPKEQESFFSPKLPEKTLHISFARHEQRIFTHGYTFSFGGKKYIVPDKTFPAFPGDVLTVVSGKYCQVQVIYKDQLYDVEKFVRFVPGEGKPRMTYEELSKKRSEWGRMGRRASPFG